MKVQEDLETLAQLHAEGRLTDEAFLSLVRARPNRNEGATDALTYRGTPVQIYLGSREISYPCTAFVTATRLIISSRVGTSMVLNTLLSSLKQTESKDFTWGMVHTRQLFAVLLEFRGPADAPDRFVSIHFAGADERDSFLEIMSQTHSVVPLPLLDVVERS